MDKGMSILVVDDFFIMWCIVCSLFKELGFINVEEVEDGQEVLGKLKGGDFEFVVLDWNMFNFDGLEMFKQICVDDVMKVLLVLMVIVEVKKENIVVVVQVGVNGYIVKLFIVVILEEKFNKIFEKLGK